MNDDDKTCPHCGRAMPGAYMMATRADGENLLGQPWQRAIVSAAVLFALWALLTFVVL